MNTQKPKLIVIVGPTASGKTEFAIALAEHFGGEIVSADSRQIYKGMDIGTAKPHGTWRIINGKKIFSCKGVRHHLIDFLTPNKPFTVAQYKTKATQAIKAVLSRKRLPILVGGTGLYIKAIVDNLDIPRVPPNQKLRAELEKNIKEKWIKHLFDTLVALDPEAAYIVDPKNPRRVIRALEITIATRIPFSKQRTSGKQLFDTLQIGINVPKKTFHARIDTRINAMMKQGLLNEVRTLIKQYGARTKVFDAIGYRELIPCIDNPAILPYAVDLMKKNTRNYAKRQITWFKKDKRIHWVSSLKEAKRLVKNFLA